jgi:hypothetical protein
MAQREPGRQRNQSLPGAEAKKIGV